MIQPRIQLRSGVYRVAVDTSNGSLHTQIMTLADKMTASRLVLSPIFFVIYLFFGAFWTVPVLWILFIVSEITDMLDGMIARKQGEVSDTGKLFDPFADTLTQVTYFLCFVIDGILTPFFFLLVLYREFSISFVRNLMLKKGVTMGARMSGKVKTVSYITAGALALLAASIARLGFDYEIYRWALIAARAVFIFSVAVAVFSFIDYLAVFFKTSEGK